ncbi:DNRLRE domain-containing protein [Lysinibacillus cavernae]|uniref:DNRLRE domain-containing protein n=1 Tax=Lysinibacillus cavernae TaxID=2666135 RepID=UPI0012D8DEFE|nr:DNRLRE domain-containing protein [Lysinibacillus cavernae]
MEDQDFGLETDISSHRIKLETENTIPFDKSFDVYTEIEVSPHNSFKATYKLIAVGKIEQDVEIIARPLNESRVQTELISRALSVSNRDTYLNIMYRGNSEVYTEIQPIGYNFLEAEIEVPPHNRMYAIYEVQQPPIVTDVYNPTQDAFTREEAAYQSINYGSNSSMVVGRSKDDIWRSFVQFDLSSIHPSYVLKESYLRLYYKGADPENLKLEILNASSEWQETNITHLNRPIPIDLIADKFTGNSNQRYIEFDVLEIVEYWVALEKNNNGFIIRLSNETAFGQAIFYTRETFSPPELIVKYYDSRIFSQGRSQQLTEIFAYKRNHSERFTEVTVDSIFSFENIYTEIYVHRPEVPLDFEAQAEITITKPYIETEIISSIRDKNEVLIEVGVRRSLEGTIFTEVTINAPFTLAQIDCARIDTSSLDTTVSITRPSINAEISVPFHDKNEVFTEIEINDIWTSIVYTELFVAKDKIAIEITPRVGKDSNLFAVIHVSKPKIETEIEIKHRNDILVEIEPNIKSDVFTEIIVSKPYIDVSIAVQLYDKSEEDTEIFVKFVQAIFSELNVKAVSQVDTVIDIKMVSQVHTEISVNRRFVQTEITIPTWADQEVPAIIEPRILMVDNKITIITVNGSVSGYAFIL